MVGGDVTGGLVVGGDVTGGLVVGGGVTGGSVGGVVGGGTGFVVGVVGRFGFVVGVVPGFVVGGPERAPPASDASPNTATAPVCSAMRYPAEDSDARAVA